MKIAHNTAVSVFCKPEDNEAEIKEALACLFPFDLEKEKIAINEQNAAGFSERKIKIFGIRLVKDAQINAFLQNLKESLGEEQSKMIVEQAESRLDDEMFFFIRLDKEKLAKERKYLLTDDSNCFHIKVCMAAFPKKRDIAIGLISGFFSK